ncbi:hypothetical protein FNV43_RR13336 [Rhamnella rubrinervis]|uniref:Uncharacterized protein n=1 Tax=Rhamnella rubrinervis TaxID=2594499 RepID=A0A8K0MF20_9ROSA|nr:hypothetical protein FNV43_RR13336 [Rhamnella rubrinervis]
MRLPLTSFARTQNDIIGKFKAMHTDWPTLKPFEEHNVDFESEEISSGDDKPVKAFGTFESPTPSAEPNETPQLDPPTLFELNQIDFFEKTIRFTQMKEARLSQITRVVEGELDFG